MPDSSSLQREVEAEPRRSRGPRAGPRDTLTAFQHEHGLALKQFRLEAAELETADRLETGGESGVTVSRGSSSSG
jgi:hypothetical protein